MALSNNLTGAVRDTFLSFHVKHRDAFLEMPAAIKHHHATVGGYAVHICEVTDNLLKLLTAFGETGFTRQDAVVAAYVHDLDKLFWRYQRDAEPPTDAQVKFASSLGLQVTAMDSKSTLSQRIDAKKNDKPLDTSAMAYHTRRDDCPTMDDSAAVATLMIEHQLPGWNRAVAEAVSLHHGGWAPLAQAGGLGKFPPLATLLHAADLISANVQNGEA